MARAQGLTLILEDGGKARPVAALGLAEIAPEGLRRRHRDTVLRQGDGRGQQILPPCAAAHVGLRVAKGAIPAVHDRRRGQDRPRPARRERSLGGRAVDPLSDGQKTPLLPLAVHHHPDRIAAQSAEMRHDHGQHGPRRDQRLGRGAALSQHLHPRRRGQRMRRGQRAGHGAARPVLGKTIGVPFLSRPGFRTLARAKPPTGPENVVGAGVS